MGLSEGLVVSKSMVMLRSRRPRWRGHLEAMPMYQPFIVSWALSIYPSMRCRMGIPSVAAEETLPI